MSLWTGTLRLGGLALRLESPVPLDLHPHLRPYLEPAGAADRRVRLTTEPPDLPGDPVYEDFRLAVYETPFGWAREFRIWAKGEKNPENPCLIPTAPQVYALHLPAAKLPLVAAGMEFSFLLGLEEFFAAHGALLLHSTSVVEAGRAWVFSAPAGVGKSTHAALWTRCFGARPLTGDRSLIRREGRGFRVWGSPFCGSSDLTVRDSAPLGGILLLRQGPENRIETLGPGEIFRRLLALTTQDPWDRAMVSGLLDLAADLPKAVPVLGYTCRPDEAAAHLARRTLLGAGEKEKAP